MSELTAAEYDSLSRAIRAPEFPSLFNEYLNEISDPSHRKELIDYMNSLEAKGEVPRGKRLVRPKYWLRLETHEKNKTMGKSIYLNLMYSDAIESSSVNSTTGEVRIPFLTSSARLEKNHNVSIDVLVGEGTVSEYKSRGTRFLVLLSEMIIENLKTVYLSKDVRLVKNEDSDIIPFLIDDPKNSTPQIELIPSQSDNPTRPDEEETTHTACSYKISYMYGSTEISFDENRIESSRPEKVKVKIILPGVESAGDIHIESNNEGGLLVTAGKGIHNLCIPMKVRVELEKGEGVFDKSRSTLTLKFPL